jgi:hypothetical protein
LHLLEEFEDTKEVIRIRGADKTMAEGNPYVPVWMLLFVVFECLQDEMMVSVACFGSSLASNNFQSISER